MLCIRRSNSTLRSLTVLALRKMRFTPAVLPHLNCNLCSKKFSLTASELLKAQFGNSLLVHMNRESCGTVCSWPKSIPPKLQLWHAVLLHYKYDLLIWGAVELRSDYINRSTGTQISSAYTVYFAVCVKRIIWFRLLYNIHITKLGSNCFIIIIISTIAIYEGIKGLNV